MHRLARAILSVFLILPLNAAWLKNLDDAKAAAAEANKDIYLVFTSLQVSGACVQLEKRVLSQQTFQKAAEGRFILVHLDVPLEMKPGMISPLAANRMVAKKFGVEAYPTAFYLDAQTRSYASEAGAIIGGPEECAARLVKRADERQGQKAALESAYEKEGLDRAKAIIEVLKNAPIGATVDLFADDMTELARLDPKDSLGFQKPRLAEQGFRDLDRALEEVFHKDSYEEVVKLIDGYIAEFQPEGALLQKALFPKLAALKHGKNPEAAVAAAREVIAVDATSAHGKLAAQILARLQAK